MKTTAAVILLVLVLGACGELSPGSGTAPPSEPTSTVQPGPTTTAAPSTSTATGEDAHVVMTASAVAQPDGSIELCPPRMTGACPGIVLFGEIEPDLISSQDDPTVIQVTGQYDGRRLLADSAPIETDYPPGSVDFSSLCPDLRGSGSVSPNSPQMESVTAYATAQPDYAALWFDRDSAIFSVWFQGGDVSGHRTAIVALAEGEPVCVVGGADFSEAELLQASAMLASELLAGFTDSRGLPIATLGFSFGTIAYSVGGRSNRVDLPLEEIDAETREALAELTGNRVVPYPYIELVDAPMSELPDPILAVDGDVDILTSRVREDGGMAALALAELHYDPALNCVYTTGRDEGEQGRTVPVWPFGYAATSSPMTVYDYDGVPVASDGDPIDLGGGNVGLDFIEGNNCDADGAWIVNR